VQRVSNTESPIPVVTALDVEQRVSNTGSPIPVVTALDVEQRVSVLQAIRSNDDSITKQALQRTPQGHRGRGRPRNTWRRDLEKERNVDSRIQVQLEEDGGDSTRQSCMETRHKPSKSSTGSPIPVVTALNVEQCVSVLEIALANKFVGSQIKDEHLMAHNTLHNAIFRIVAVAYL